MAGSTANPGHSTAQGNGLEARASRCTACAIPRAGECNEPTKRLVHPVLFRVGEVAVYSYGVMMLAALGAGFVALLLAAIRLRYSFAAAGFISCVLPVGLLFGAKAGWLVLHFDEVMRDGRWLGGGMLLMPALLVALVCAAVLGLLFKQHVGATLDVTVIALATGIGVGRVGCFLAGCCVGKPTSLPWGLVFPTGDLIPQAMHDVPLHPTQLYELVLFTLLASALLWRGPKRRFAGELTLVAIAVFGVVSVVEPFVRLDETPVPFRLVAWTLVVLAALAATMVLGRRASPAAIA